MESTMTSSPGSLLPGRPRFNALHLEFTNQCNLRCRHCYNIDYVKGQADDLTTAQIKAIIDRSRASGCRNVGFSGGEPFLREDIFELLEYCKAYPVHILTNGTLLDEETLDRVDAIEDLVVEFRISVDGLASHRLLRGQKVDRVLDGIRRLLDRDHIVTVSTMVTEHNLDELMAMYDVMLELGVDRWRLDFVYLSGNAARFNIRYDNPRRMLGILDQLIDRYISERPPFLFDINKVFRSAFLDHYEPFSYDLDTRPCSYQGSLTVRPNGDVSFCPSMGPTFGNILTQSPEEIADSEAWRSFDGLRVRDLAEKCQECPYLSWCGGGCRADGYYETGDMRGISELTCVLIEYFVESVRPKIEAARAARGNNGS